MRPRERYRHHGPASFGDAELLALVLGTGAGGCSALGIAAGLLDRHGDLAGVAEAPVEALARQVGIGPARAVQLHAALQAGRRSAAGRVDLERPVCTPRDAWEHLGPLLGPLDAEELHALYLDRRRRPCGHRRLTRGNDGFTVVDPRQVFRPAVAFRAHALVLAHNHPSGDPTPSAQDREVTRRVGAAGRILGIALLDHLVVAGTRWVSLAERGEVPAWTPEPVPAVADHGPSSV